MKFVKPIMAGLLLTASVSQATVITFADTDFSMTANFNRLRDFSFSIEIAEPLAAGMLFVNPTLVGVEYAVFGILDTDPTPSGFPAFDLQRTIGGAEFYSQGSSFNLGISASADLTDGLQMSEITEFTFNAREIGTGRYHPVLLELFPDGSGSLQNSNNTGGINPGNGLVVDVDFGEEYQVDLNTSNTFTLADTVTVPEPSSALLLSLGCVGLFLRKR